MKMDIVAGSKYDEFYTPEYAIRPILKYLKQNSKIWCPFDTEDSIFVKILRKENHIVICSHISKSENFFHEAVNVEDADYIISNPPYSKKNEVFERLFRLGKPFMMLVGVVGIFESQFRFNMFKDNDFEIMYFNKRISYFKDYSSQKLDVNPPFSSVYICHNVLPKQIIFEVLEDHKTIIKKESIIEEKNNPNMCNDCGFLANTKDEFEKHLIRQFHLNSLTFEGERY